MYALNTCIHGTGWMKTALQLSHLRVHETVWTTHKAVAGRTSLLSKLTGRSPSFIAPPQPNLVTMYRQI